MVSQTEANESHERHENETDPTLWQQLVPSLLRSSSAGELAFEDTTSSSSALLEDELLVLSPEPTLSSRLSPTLLPRSVFEEYPFQERDGSEKLEEKSGLKQINIKRVKYKTGLYLTFEKSSTFYFLLAATGLAISSDILMLLQTTWLRQSWILVLSISIHLGVLGSVIATVYTINYKRQLSTLCLISSCYLLLFEIIPLWASWKIVGQTFQRIWNLQDSFSLLFMNHLWVTVTRLLALIFLSVFCTRAYMDFHFYTILSPRKEQKDEKERFNISSATQSFYRTKSFL